MALPGPRCGYCQSASILVDASAVYGPKYEGRFSVWQCSNYPECDSYVGAATGQFPSPVGTLANAELRGLRRRLYKAIGSEINGLTKRKDRQRRKELEALRNLVGWQTEDQCRRHLATFNAVEEDIPDSGPWWVERA